MKKHEAGLRGAVLLGIFSGLLFFGGPSSAQVPAGDLFTTYDRWGNIFSVSNRFDGTNYYIQVTLFTRGGATLWNKIHYDGYQERANTVGVDANGNLYIAGVRFWQGVRNFLLLKYSPQGDLLWERVDSYRDCTAFNLVTNPDGHIWVAGSCLSGNATPMRLVRFDSGGGILWGKLYDKGGRHYVQGLTIDQADRVSVTVQILAGSYAGAYLTQTVVYNKQGDQVASY